MNKRMGQQLCILIMGTVLLVLVVMLAGNRDTRTFMKGTELETGQDVTMQKETEKIKDTKKKENVPASIENPQIRVLINGDHYNSSYHQRIVFRCTAPYTVSYGDTVEEHMPQEIVTITPDDPWLAQGSVIIELKEANGEIQMPELARASSNPSYAGKMEVEKRAEGLIIINELPLETYLCSVVPSEMPSSYPMEALKAQAICARTYAMQQMEGDRGAEFGVDLDDSVSYQVYNNIEKEARTTQAVQETAGKVMRQGGALTDAYYYSTSCGIDLSQDLSEEAVFCAFMTGGTDQAYEKEEPWYRWTASFTLEELTRLVESNLQSGFGAVTGLTIDSREKNGAIRTLLIEGKENQLQVDGEYAIRKFLQTDSAGVTLQDGSEAPNLGMLPSAFFYLTPVYEGQVMTGYDLTGGGYGHGNGMSQNGAKHMADAGKKASEILKFYYGEISIK